MRTRELKALKIGDRVRVTGTQDEKSFVNETGVVVSVPWINDNERCIKFDTWRDGWSSDVSRRSVKDHWMFSEAQCRQFNIRPEAPKVTEPVVAKKRPHGKQEYKGNGSHEWETVTGNTVRLRVPGGWLYGKQPDGCEVMSQTTFVPVPEAVGYAV